jgi:lipopolysaccharide/colanic/teichoic acid biosynthesis glycosyltransferase
MKRAFDVVVSGGLLLLVLPVIVIAAVASAAALRAWPFFTQDRVGRGGELFRFLKIRTLPVDVAAYTDKHQLTDVEIPPVCRLMRRLHLDELPQLLLVLRGRMSLVGPRPEMAYLHESMPEGFSELRTSVRPGCTGLWQVSESCIDLISHAPEYDCFYLTNESLRLDAWILFRTGLKMIDLGRPVTLADVPEWAGGAIVDIDAEDPVGVPVAAGR